MRQWGTHGSSPSPYKLSIRWTGRGHSTKSSRSLRRRKLTVWARSCHSLQRSRPDQHERPLADLGAQRSEWLVRAQTDQIAMVQRTAAILGTASPSRLNASHERGKMQEKAF